MVSALPQLTKLDFYNQLLTGTLPANISLPKLVELRLIANDISVRPSRMHTLSGRSFRWANQQMHLKHSKDGVLWRQPLSRCHGQ